MDTLKELLDFFNVEVKKFNELPVQTIEKMSKALETGEIMKLHHLGYELVLMDNQ